MNKPSSTITAATLAGLSMTMFWELVQQFTAVEIRASLIAASVALASGMVGYLKKENVLPIDRSKQ
jgi:Co/Zn/Cd efflux system component